MQIKTDSKLSDWWFVPIGLAIFALPSVAVTVNSGATTIFLLILLPSLILGWKSWEGLFREEKILLISFLVFVILVGFSFINNSDVSENFSSYEKYLRFTAFIPMYMFFRRYSLELGPWLSWGLILGGTIMGLIIIYQYHWLDILRPTGARNPARYGLVAVIIFLLLTLIIIFEWRRTKLLLLGLISAVIILYAIKLNQTRAAMLAIFPFLGMLLIYYRHNINKKLALIFSLVAVILAVIFLHPSSPIAHLFLQGFVELKNAMQNPAENNSSSWGLRPHMLHVGLLVFIESPIFGTGLGDYAQDAQLLMDSGKTYVQDAFLLTSPHNIYVNLLAEAGILGFLGLIAAVCFAPLYCYLKIYKRNPGNYKINLFVLSGITVSISYLMFGMFHTWININNSVSIFLLLHLVYLSNAYVMLQKNESENLKCLTD